MHRLPPHISYTLLHFLNMTRAAPRDSTRSRYFRTLLVEGGVCRASLRGRGGGGEVRRFAGQAPFYMQNFTGRGSEIASRQANEVRRGK